MATSLIPDGQAVLTVDTTGTITDPSETAIERATREAQDRLGASGTAAIPEGEEPKGERNKDGTFKESPKAADDRTPAAGRAAPKSEATAGEGEEGDEEIEGEEGAETAKAAKTGTTATGDELTVILPGRNRGDEWEFTADSPEAAERLRQLSNGYMRGDEVKVAAQQIVEEREALDREYLTAQVDPAGFLLTAIEENPEITLADGTTVHSVDHLLLYLASQPDVWARVGSQLLALEDDAERRAMRGDQIALRNAVNAQLASATETQVQVRQNLQDVQATVGSLLPTEWTEDQQRLLYADCLGDLKAHADRFQLKTIPVHDIPVILAQRLRAHGINPVEAAARATESAQRRGSAAARRPAPGARPARAAAPSPKPAAPSGQKFVVRAQQRQKAGTPAAGSGSPAATAALTAPRNADGSKMSIEQTLAWHRQTIAANKKKV